MKKKQYQSSEERTILIGMITSDEVLDQIARNLKGDAEPFRSKWSNLVARWCLAYWEKYRHAPKKNIQSAFAKYAAKSQDEDMVALVEKFLQSLSEDFGALAEEMNVQFVVDTASRFFNGVRLERTSKKIQTSLEVRDVEAADEAFRSHQPIQFVAGREPNPFDEQQIKDWLNRQESETLVQFPGALGTFIGNAFERDAFIAFAGPEKRGKSYWLMEVVWKALCQRRRVLYYVVGDMSEKQAMVRLLCRAARRPYRTKEVALPLEIVRKKDKVIVHCSNEERKGLSPKVAFESMSRVLVKTATQEPRLKSRIYESSTIAAADVESEIVELAKQDWVPDVIVIDYADILTAEPHAKHLEYRHQVNETWKTLRRISQRFHLCLVTATQTAATSYDSKTIKKMDFSEDKRKAAHVTGMLGINQTSQEKTQGIYRLNWVFLRDGVWADHQVVFTAGNLGIGCPCIISALF